MEPTELVDTTPYIIFILLVGTLILVWRLSKKFKRINVILTKVFASNSIKRILGIIIIAGLMGTDFTAVMQMLWTSETAKMHVDKATVELFGLAFAALLEGLPAFAGGALANLLDEATIYKNDYRNALIGFFASFGASIAVLILVWKLRGQYNSVTFTAMSGSEDKTIAVQNLFNFLQYSPILTSIFSFIISWRWLRIDRIELLQNKVVDLGIDYSKKDDEYRTALKKYNNARIKLWSWLTSNQNMPEDLHKYNKEIHRRARSKLLHDCMISYENQVDLFTAIVKTELESYLVKMARHSNMKDEIINIKIDDIIKRYDAAQNANILCWDSEKAKPEYEDMILNALKNDIPQYQAVTNIDDYPVEF